MLDLDDAAVDWFMGARALGIPWANALEDRRLADEQAQGGPVTFLEALACDLVESCDLAGITYFHEGAFYFTPSDPWGLGL